MDYESSDSRSKGCWDPDPLVKPFLENWANLTETPDFIIDDVWCGMVATMGFGGGVTPETTAFWIKALKDVYKGDQGRKKVRMAVLCLVTRDGLLSRLGDIRCPVYWLQVSLVVRDSFLSTGFLLYLYPIYVFTFPNGPTIAQNLYTNWMEQGTEDVVYGVIVPPEQIKLFKSSKEAKLIIVQGGAHYLSATSPTEVSEALFELVSKYK